MEYKLIRTEKKYDGWLKLDNLFLKQKLFDGTWSEEFTREVIVRTDAVVGLIVDPVCKKLLLTCQLRPGGILRDTPYIYEMVAGMIDKGETPEQALIREAEEEAGVKGLKNIEFISSYFPSCGGSSEKIHLYYAESNLSDLPDYGGCPEENEMIEIVVLSYEEAFSWQKEGKIGTANGHVALNWLRYKLLSA